MRQVNIIIILVSILLLNVSCDGGGESTNFYELKIVFNQKLNKSKIDKALPSNLTFLLGFTKMEDESKECFGKYYTPRISFYRADLDKEERIDFPIAEMPIMMESIITPDELDNNYDETRIKTPKLLTISTKGNTVVENDIDDNTYVLNIYKDSKESVGLLKAKIEDALCGGASSIKIIIQDDKKLGVPIVGVQGGQKPTKEGLDTKETRAVGPCNNPSLVELMSLRNELLQVIDTSSSMSERSVLAEQIWNKYFDSDAYVANYQHKDDKNPEVWEPGEGREYFISRIAILKSITDITIFRVEYSKDDHKITGIKLIECHNASELQ
jgi:hypothetical protein